MDPRHLKAKSLRILQDHNDVLTYIVDEEIRKLAAEKVVGDSEYETLRRVFMTEGIKEGLRRVLQRLNENASKDI